MKLKTILKYCIAAEIACGILAIVSTHIFDNFLPLESQQYILRTKHLDFTLLRKLGLALGIPMLFFQIYAWIALWKLKKKARLIYTGCAVVGTLVMLMLRPVYVYNPVRAFLGELTTLSSGIILGLIYFTDLKLHFMNKTPNKDIQPDAE